MVQKPSSASISTVGLLNVLQSGLIVIEDLLCQWKVTDECLFSCALLEIFQLASKNHRIQAVL